MLPPTMSLESMTAIRAALAAEGHAYLPAFSADPAAILPFARALGSLYARPNLDPENSLIESRPAADASHLAPFDRPEGIGWHNDFSTHSKRPTMSLAYLAHADPRGPEHGAWRVASCDAVLEHLNSTPEGGEVVHFLLTTDLPYSFTGDGLPLFFRVIERRGPPPGRLGLRFYGRALRDGARLAYGDIPDEIAFAIAHVEDAADHVGRVLAAPAGALLITDNWHSLHDRLPQSVDLDMPRRRSLLCFVDALHE